MLKRYPTLRYISNRGGWYFLTFLAAVTPKWRIFSRPTPAVGNDGVSFQVIASTAVDAVSTLRSRRT